jgi:hypothetical protein
MSANNTTHTSSSCSESPNLSRETALVVDEDELGWRGVAPAPVQEIEVRGRDAPRAKDRTRSAA